MVGGTRWKHRSGSASLTALRAETAETVVSPLVRLESLQHPWGMYKNRDFPRDHVRFTQTTNFLLFVVWCFPVSAHTYLRDPSAAEGLVELGLPQRLHRRWLQMLHDRSLQHADGAAAIRSSATTSPAEIGYDIFWIGLRQNLRETPIFNG